MESGGLREARARGLSTAITGHPVVMQSELNVVYLRSKPARRVEAGVEPGDLILGELLKLDLSLDQLLSTLASSTQTLV